jgi:hypothetical protein
MRGLDSLLDYNYGSMQVLDKSREREESNLQPTVETPNTENQGFQRFPQ